MLNSGPRSSLQLRSGVSKASEEKIENNLPPVNKSATGGPVQFEDTGRVGNRRAVQIERLLGSFRSLELNEAVARIAVGRSVGSAGER